MILVRGHFQLSLTDETIELDGEGDYVTWGAGVDHAWRALADSIVITVRWPSAPGPGA